MTNIEQKALALVRKEDGKGYLNYDAAFAALCRAIEQHEAFRQEVSDIAEAHFKHAFTVQEKHLSGYKVTVGFEKQNHAVAWFDQLLSLPKFIIPKPKPDPLVAALEGVTFDHYPPNDAKTIRAVLDAAGFEIKEKNDDQH